MAPQARMPGLLAYRVELPGAVAVAPSEQDVRRESTRCIQAQGVNRSW
jgi:hypothetical protein